MIPALNRNNSDLLLMLKHLVDERRLLLFLLSSPNRYRCVLDSFEISLLDSDNFSCEKQNKNQIIIN